MGDQRVRIAVMALAAALVCAGGAMAQIPFYGGVSKLAPNVLRQAADCFGAQAPLYNPGAASNTVPTGTFTFTVKGVTSSTNCANTKVLPNILANLEAAGERADVQAIFQHDPTLLGAYTDASGVSGRLFPTLHFVTSDLPVEEADAVVYSSGGTFLKGISKTVSIAAPGAIPTAGQTANPSALYGPLVQVPILIAPIAIAFSPIYKKVVAANGSVVSYSFNVTSSRTVNKGSFRLDLATFCKIFNGQITNWNDPAFAVLNGAPILDSHGNVTGYTPISDPKDPDVLAGRGFSVPIELVGRSDLSGQTAIFTRAIAAQCANVAGVTNKYADASLVLPTAVIGPGGVATPGSGLFTTFGKNSQVAAYVAFGSRPGGAPGTELVQGRIAYLTPDWVAPFNKTSGLSAAALQNLADPLHFILPTPASARAAYASAPLPTDIDPTDPGAWAQPDNKTAEVASPTGAAAYPIVGADYFLAYTCYADQQKNSDVNVGYRLNQFLGYLLVSSLVTAPGGILESSGFSAPPPPLRIAAYKEFVANTNFDYLQISSKSDVIQAQGSTRRVLFAHNPVCNAYAGG
jgi:ABC-type phosphate transport system substrate-binding protein